MLGCSDESNPVANNPEPSIEGNSYYNPALNFKISAPEGWNLSKDIVEDGFELLLIGEQNDISGYHSSFNVISEHAGSQTNVLEIFPTAKEYINSTFSAVEYYSERIINTGGFECGELVYKLSQDGISLIQKQLYFFINEFIIVITFNSLSSFYVQSSADFDFIQNSLKTIQ